MKRTNIYLEESQSAALDEKADAAGISRSEFIRRCLDQALNEGATDRDAVLAAVRASFGVCAEDDPDELIPRGSDERAAHLERLWEL